LASAIEGGRFAQEMNRALQAVVRSRIDDILSASERSSL
jgi:hypothetical protein